jgi:hypothetical protein
MGCDIHMYVEYRHDGRWVCGDYFEVNPYYPKCGPEYSLVELYGYRDYALFGILAGVRKPEMPRIDDPRDLPEDCNDFIKKEYESWGIDAHSCSWLTLQELIDFQDKVGPTYDYGGYILENLINKLKERANELNLIYDFQWTGNERSEREAYKKSAGIRIVFWFDN